MYGDIVHAQLASQLADILSRSRGAFRPSFASSIALFEKRAQGRPGAAGTEIRALENAHGVDHRCCRIPAFPARNGCNGFLRALLGERCTIAPVALRMADARARSGCHITARLDAQTPGVRTTRLLRPRTSLPIVRGLTRARPRHQQVRCYSAVSCHGSQRLTGFARPAVTSRADAAASTASRPAYRDDRERPFDGPGWKQRHQKTEIR